MNNLALRALSGVVFLAIMLAGILLNQYGFMALLALLILGISLEVSKLVLQIYSIRNATVPIVQSLFLSVMFLGYAFLHLNPLLLCLVFWLLFVTVNIVFHSFNVLVHALFAMLCLLVWAPFTLLWQIGFEGSEVFGEWVSTQKVLPIFILVWVNDTMAYVGGRSIGKRPLHSKVSPNKTWEGFFSGLLFAGLASYCMTYWELGFIEQPGYIHIVAGITVGSMATLGDLFQSALKRAAGVKDSGNLIPGHGGVWDRFDGVLFAIPTYFILNLILS